MLNVTHMLISHVNEQARAHYSALFGAREAGVLAWVEQAVEDALEAIGGSDALYHNTEHTTFVTLVGMEIIAARQREEQTLTPAEWGSIVVSLLCHDIGYVSDLESAANMQGAARQNEDTDGGSDAVLMPVHVNRGKQYVEKSFLAERYADIGLINACIERTRFPVPEDAWYAETGDWPGLVRAADLIGQLSDPRYLNKLTALFYEFEETGFNRTTGYQRPGDLLVSYPAFFDNFVKPYIRDAEALLKRSEPGRDILDHLYDNLARARDAVDAGLPQAANS